MNSRATILARIRARLATGERAAAVARRLHERPAAPLPAQAQGDAATLQRRFVERARGAAAEVIELERREPGAEQGPEAKQYPEAERDPAAEQHPVVDLIARRLAEEAPGGPLVVDRALAPQAEAWRAQGLEAVGRRARPGDAAGVSRAFCAIAETGTVMLCSGAGQPTTAAFLPPLHVVVVARSDIVGSYEAAWAKLEASGPMPRTVNWITGPSRSADIEQTLNLGAHGPLRLLVLLVDE